MKTIQLFLCLILSGYFNSLFAQEESGNGALFPQFEKGFVIFKNGAQTPASLNYDLIQERMLFLDADGTVMTLNKSRDIVAVNIGERRFSPVSAQGAFYEVLQAGDNSFYVKRRASVVSKGKAAAYGGYSQTSSTTSYGSWYNTIGGTSKLNPDEQIKLEIKYTYYLKSGNSYKQFVSPKTLGKLFKGHESEIQEFADKNSINFSKTDDVARIVEFVYGLNSK